jgi:hypothetical protein
LARALQAIDLRRAPRALTPSMHARVHSKQRDVLMLTPKHVGPANRMDHSAKPRLVVINTLVCSYKRLSRWNNSAPPARLNGR